MDNLTRVCEKCGCQFRVKWRCRKPRFCSKSCAHSGKNNPQWVGDKVGIVQVHTWMERELGRPDRCSKCGKIGKVDLANKSNKYKRDPNDWEWLCRKCHMESDGRMEKFLSYSNMHNRIPNRTCNQCGKEYWPHLRNSKFCGHSCRATFHNLNTRYYSKR